MKHFFTLAFFIFSICTNTFSSQFKLTLKLNKNLDHSKLNVFYFDGEIVKAIHPTFTNNTAIINEIIKSRYARLVFNYPDKLGRLPGFCFLVTKGSATLQFNEVSQTEINNISNYKFENLIDKKNTIIYNAIAKYTKNELQAFDKICAESNLSPTDTLLAQLRINSYEVLALKQIEFIKLHPTNYFYFENFIHDIVPALKPKYLAELYEIFNASFPVSFKDSYEGKCAKTLLEGKLYVKVGMQCPPFKTTDYLGNEISTEKLKGKYYLLSFWATWCAPCVKEIPQLKNIRDTYTEKEISIISITRDSDSTKFITGVNNYKMNWVHIFNSYAMQNLFGEKPIPSVYLIDKNGKIIFSSWEIALTELEVILKKELNK